MIELFSYDIVKEYFIEYFENVREGLSRMYKWICIIFWKFLIIGYLKSKDLDWFRIFY